MLELVKRIITRILYKVGRPALMTHPCPTKYFSIREVKIFFPLLAKCGAGWRYDRKNIRFKDQFYKNNKLQIYEKGWCPCSLKPKNITYRQLMPSESSTNQANKPKKGYRRRGGQRKPRKPRESQDREKSHHDNDALTNWKRNVIDPETEKELLKRKKDAISNKNKVQNETEEDSSLETCVVCANRIRIAALSPCNHVVCHMCAFRQRALFEKKQCLVCRTDADKLIFTDNPPASHKYSDVPRSSIISSNSKYGLEFTSKKVEQETFELLQYRCPVKDCHQEEKDGKTDDKEPRAPVFTTFKGLNQHVRDAHNKVYCQLCGKFKKAFISELPLYTTRELHIHESKGLSNEEGFKGHPMCKFCSGQRFYSEDELFIHMREKHERCQVCDQIDASHPQYFRDYKHLFEHFKEAHFICNVQSCLDKKFIVFANEFDLQAHMIKEHGNIYGTDQVMLPSAGLEYDGSNARSSAPGFRTRLSTLRGRSTKSKTSKDKQDSTESREVKSLRLQERARHYLHYSQSAFDKFTDCNKGYDDGKITASELVAKYKEIFGSKRSDEEGPVDYAVLIYELSRLYPSSSPKRKALDRINSSAMQRKKLDEQFPSLPGSSSNLQQGWDPPTKSSNQELFPSLPASRPVSFRSGSVRMSKSSSSPSWAPPLNAASIPGYLPKKSRRRIKTHSASLTNSRNTSSTSLGSVGSSSSSLGGAWGASVSARPSVHVGTSTKPLITSYSSSRSNSNSGLNDSMFPELPTVRKKVIPRVHPVKKTVSPWENRQTSAPSNSNTRNANDMFNMDSVRGALNETTNSQNKKKGKKKKKILLKIGVGH